MTITFTEQKRNQPCWSGWYRAEIDHIDTHFSIDGAKPIFLRGVAGCAPDYEKREIESLKQQLIDNGAKFIRFYCDAQGMHVEYKYCSTLARAGNTFYESGCI